MNYKIKLSEPNVGMSEILSTVKVLKSGLLSQGSIVGRFESNFVNFHKSGASAIAVNSGTSALHLGLLSAKIGEGDEVIVPAFSFAATANAVALVGAKPVFADIDEDTLCLSLDSIEASITKKTKAIIIVHLFGNMPNMERLVEISDKHKLLLIEDAAQALGSKYNKKYAGTFGEFGAFSFYPTKNLTTGEGGMIMSHNMSLLRNAKLLRNQGMIETYKNEVIGFNNRMTEISGGIGLAQLKKLNKFLDKRKENARYYFDKIKNVNLPKHLKEVEHSFNQFTIRVDCKRRSILMEEFFKEGIEVKIYYPKPINDLDAYQVKADIPTTNRVLKEVLSIPVHTKLKEKDLFKIVKIINKNT